MRLTEHTFVREYQPSPFDLLECTRCKWPAYFCSCDPGEDDLPAYRGCDPSQYTKGEH